MVPARGFPYGTQLRNTANLSPFSFHFLCNLRTRSRCYTGFPLKTPLLSIGQYPSRHRIGPQQHNAPITHITGALPPRCRSIFSEKCCRRCFTKTRRFEAGSSLADYNLWRWSPERRTLNSLRYSTKSTAAQRMFALQNCTSA